MVQPMQTDFIYDRSSHMQRLDRILSEAGVASRKNDSIIGSNAMHNTDAISALPALHSALVNTSATDDDVG